MGEEPKEDIKLKPIPVKEKEKEEPKEVKPLKQKKEKKEEETSQVSKIDKVSKPAPKPDLLTIKDTASTPEQVSANPAPQNEDQVEKAVGLTDQVREEVKEEEVREVKHDLKKEEVKPSQMKEEVKPVEVKE